MKLKKVVATARSLPSAATTRCSAFARRNKYSRNSRAMFCCIKGVNELCRRYPTVSRLPGFLMLNDTTTAEFSVLFAARFCIWFSTDEERQRCRIVYQIKANTYEKSHFFSAPGSTKKTVGSETRASSLYNL